MTEVAPFGNPVYSREGLVAELSAMFLCAEAGISPVRRSKVHTPYGGRTLSSMASIEVTGIVEDGRNAHATGEVSVQLSATPPTEWVGLFGQAWILAVVERTIPADFGQGASVRENRIVIRGVSREAVARQIEALRRIVEETNRMSAGYEALLRRNHDAR